MVLSKVTYSYLGTGVLGFVLYVIFGLTIYLGPHCISHEKTCVHPSHTPESKHVQVSVCIYRADMPKTLYILRFDLSWPPYSISRLQIFAKPGCMRCLTTGCVFVPVPISPSPWPLTPSTLRHGNRCVRGGCSFFSQRPDTGLLHKHTHEHTHERRHTRTHHGRSLRQTRFPQR